MARAAPALAAALLIPLLPLRAGAQACGTTPSVSAATAVISYPVSSGIAGIAAGVDGAFRVGPAQVRVGYRRALLEGSGSDPDLARAMVAIPVLQEPDVELCAVAHAGLARFALADDSGLTVAGGLGATLAARGVPGSPYLSVRGLGARVAGTVLGLDISAGGLSFGVEAGGALDLGPLTVRLTGAVDGFDDGLGVTAYPATSVELAVGYRF